MGGLEPPPPPPPGYATVREYRVLLRIGQVTKNFLALVQRKIRACFFAFRNFTMLQKQLKRRLQADRPLGINKHCRYN